jgi:hypothetical protein
MMVKNYFVLSFLFALILGSVAQVYALTEYKTIVFVGDMTQIYAKIPSFHGYTTEFLNSQEVKQVCLDANNDKVKLDYCS